MRSCIIQSCSHRGDHKFPQNEQLRAQWIRVSRFQTKKIPKFAGICSDHFKTSDYHITPPRFEGDQETKRLKKNSVPSLFPWSCPQRTPFSPPLKLLPPTNTYTRKQIDVRFVEVIENLPLIGSETNTEEHLKDPLCVENHETSNFALNGVMHSNDNWSDFVNEVEVSSSNDVNTEYHTGTASVTVTCHQATQTCEDSENKGFSLNYLKQQRTAIHFYTGLESYEKMLLVFHSLGEDVNHLNYFYGPAPKKIDVLEQFFIVLMILRLHKTFQELSMMYAITIQAVSNIFITWIRFMAIQWRKLDLWIDKSKVQAYMPLDFHDKYPHTRVIIDATEFPVKKPGLPLAQQITFSSYKNRNTVKTLVGIAAGGLISYISPSYGGSATDRSIIERSEILSNFDYNDEIMVDKGINVQDILVAYGVKVNMPAFFKKGSQITQNTLRENRKVASKRVHFERVIGQIKTYKILTQPMNRTETILSSDIVFVCAILVNFRSNIMKGCN